MASKTWSGVRGERAVMLRTFKRDGTGVDTPVGYGVDGAALYFMTKSGTGKTKRLARDPHVVVAASTLRGQLRGDFRPGIAAEITGTEAEHAHQLITAHNRIAWFFLLRGARRRGENWRYYAVTEDGPNPSSTQVPSEEHA